MPCARGKGEPHRADDDAEDRGIARRRETVGRDAQIDGHKLHDEDGDDKGPAPAQIPAHHATANHADACPEEECAEQREATKPVELA